MKTNYLKSKFKKNKFYNILIIIVSLLVIGFLIYYLTAIFKIIFKIIVT